MTPTIKIAFDSVRIYFGDILHLHFRRSKLLGIQSWRYGDHNYSIEYVMDGGTITTEYDDREKFEAILQQLDKLI